MTAPVNSDSAKRRGRSRSQRELSTARQLAALEAELARELRHAAAPSIADPADEEARGAAQHGSGGKRLDDFLRDLKQLSETESAPVEPAPPHAQEHAPNDPAQSAARHPRDPSSPRPRRATRRPPAEAPAEQESESWDPRPQLHEQAAQDPSLGLTGRLRRSEPSRPEETEPAQDVANDLDPGGRERLDWRTRALRPEPVPWIERPERTSLFVRATRVAATVFSVVALVGVSALLVLLAISDDRPLPTAREAAQAVESAATALARDTEKWPPVSAQDSARELTQNDGAPLTRVRDDTAVTGSIGAKSETSRIASDPVATSAPARGTGTVQPTGEPMGGPYVAAPSGAQPMEPKVVRSTVESRPATGGAHESTTYSTSSAQASAAMPPSRESAAQMEVAASQSEVDVADDDVNVEEAKVAESPAADAAEATRTAAVTTHVNMRSEPKNEAAVVAVVPQGRDVGIVDCSQWCEVLYDGKKGFIHKRFVKNAGQ